MHVRHFHPMEPWPENAVELVSVRHNSPLTVVLEVSGVMGCLVGIVLAGLHAYYYTRHAQVDLENKEVSRDVARELLTLLRERGIKLTPALIQKLIDNAKLKQADPPRVSRLEIGKPGKE